MANAVIDNLPAVPVIIGTAGHIDHGKSSLIRALTGTDPDRLKEEKKRGITIELGFAFLNDRIAFIDVPGHEKFVKHMVAGAATVDYALLIIAADDGVMPQTREHLDVLTLMGVEQGLVVVTKADLVEPDWLEMVQEEISDWLSSTAFKNAPIHVVDSLSGRGVPELEAAIIKLAAGKRISGGKSLFRMPIDRVFTIKGFGTVVTGSVLSGRVQKGDTLQLLPEGRLLRVKGLQSHGHEIPQSAAGERAAINLANISVEEIERGDTLASPDTLSADMALDAHLHVLPTSPAPLKHRQRVHLHLGTADILARIVLLQGDEIQPGESGYVQFRLERPTAAQRLDRFVIRRYSPTLTIGGGIILDATPARHRRNRPEVIQALERLQGGDDGGMIRTSLHATPLQTLKELSLALSKDEQELAQAIDTLLAAGDLLVFDGPKGAMYCDLDLLGQFMDLARAHMSKQHAAHPLRAGIRQGELAPQLKHKIPKAAQPLLIEHALQTGLLIRPGGDLLALPEHRVALTPEQQQAIDRLISIFDQSALTPPSPQQLADELGLAKSELTPLLTYLVDTDHLLCLEGQLFFSMTAIENAKKTLATLLGGGEKKTLSEIREVLNSTRKFALPLINYLDACGWTQRNEDDLRMAGAAMQKALKLEIES